MENMIKSQIDDYNDNIIVKKGSKALLDNKFIKKIKLYN